MKNPIKMIVKLISVVGLFFSILGVASEAELMLLAVDKGKLQAELRTLTDDPSEMTVLQTFKIAVGKNLGDKSREGDNRTPEGVYFPTQKINTSSIDPNKYGRWAIALDFPNLIDQIHGKTGYGIWIHGAGNDARMAKEKTTEGCVAFFNDDFDRLTQWIRPYQGVVAIAKDMSQINNHRDLAAVRGQTLKWLSSWRSRLIDRYVDVYHDSFKMRDMDKEKFSAYKRRVFAAYKEMQVDVDHLRVVTHPKYAISMMNQRFAGDRRFSSVGRKVLYWLRDGNGSWKIVREYFGSNRLKPLPFDAADLQKLQELARHGEDHTHRVQPSEL